jgi:hypothetical protein
MSDLWTAILTMIAISIVLIAVTAAYAPQRRETQMLCLAAILGSAFAFLFYSAGQLYWARLVPHSAVIVWANLTPFLIALAAGICWHLDKTPRWRRLAMSLSLAAVSVAVTFWPFINLAMRPQPVGGDSWNGSVAMQTSWATCSPAAAATFLTAAGMPISESKMIPRCLTDASGTPTLGLYRGVKMVANENGRELSVNEFDLPRLLNGEIDFPILLMVKLPRSGVEDPRYANQWGWIPGMGHSVVAIAGSSSPIQHKDFRHGRLMICKCSGTAIRFD